MIFLKYIFQLEIKLENMSDTAIFELSQQSEVETSKFVQKQTLYVLDSNQGAYSSNQIFFETSSLSNSGKWMSMRDSYFIIPVVIACKASVDVTATFNPFSAGFKNGYYQLIDSLTVELNGTNIVQLCPYTNIWTNFKVLNTWSKDTLTKYGPSLGVWPDTTTSLGYSAAASASGLGVYNNRVYASIPVVATALTYTGPVANTGFLNRLYSTCYTPIAGGLDGAATIYTAPNTTGMSFFTVNGGAADARVYYWSVLAKIRAKDIHDYFDKAPLLKGSYYRIVLNINTAGFLITAVAAGPTMAIATAGNVIVNGRTNPIMVASSLANNPMNGSVAAGNGTFGFSVGVGSTTAPGGATVSNAIFANGCRLYVPCYTMNPEYEEQYISMHPTKTIVYEDIYNFTISGVAASGTFNNLLTNGVVNPKKVLIVPFLRTSCTDATTISELASMFSPAGGTTSPLVAFSQFNVQVAGQNMFMSNEDYDFQQYMDELRSAFGLNGGETDQISSGLLSELDFTYAYRYYFCDVSRRLPADDIYPKSVLIQGTNTSTRVVDLICFVSLEKSITLNTINSAIVEN